MGVHLVTAVVFGSSATMSTAVMLMIFRAVLRKQKYTGVMRIAVNLAQTSFENGSRK